MNSHTDILQKSCRGAYSNMIAIFKNVIEKMKNRIRKSENGDVITIVDISETLQDLQNMINNNLCSLGFDVSISMAKLNNAQQSMNESIHNNNVRNISESQLCTIIKESVKKVLNENKQ